MPLAMFSAIPSYATRNGTVVRNGDLVGGQLVPDKSVARGMFLGASRELD